MAQFDAELKLPEDFAAALEAHPEARKRFAALPHGLKRHHVLDIEAATTEETRQRRIEKAIAALLAL
ncbi:YdeI/OmpD-associated family protein [Pelagibacterium sp. 26DY04]|uniref:YdeI/OmpD-associated family protein n=1 Tax=Pelagibacterium sp. 26DY04 TaxID=2967130 RepID=UPI002814FAF9|nr:YdeI/OmpD-associated family protein [Pelagibacterium sp. 26DY04]WMT87121.1 YdeI/OmpD-associated family protein [Pelagibacterium sp. 26DY04]